MRVLVPLPTGLSAPDWAARYRRGEVPDLSPYGLHKLERYGATVEFDSVELEGAIGRVAAMVRNRTDGLELVEAPYRRSGRGSGADAVLAYDERTGVPALLDPRRSRPAVAAGIGWLSSRSAVGRIHAALAARALPRAAAVWAQSSAALPVVHTEWTVPKSRLHFIPLGVDTDFYVEQPAPERPGIVMSAGEDRYRNHDLLVEAVARTRKRFPDVRLELATSSEVMLPPDLGMLYRGRLDGRIRDWYRRAGVVAIALRPTVTGSGLTVALEAMASGRPVVVTDNPGMSDYVSHGETGLLVPADDPDAFAAAIGELLADDDRRVEMGRRAAERVRKHFSTDRMAEAFVTMLRSL